MTDSLGDMSKALDTVIGANPMRGMLDNFIAMSDAAKPYNWQLKSEDDLSEERDGPYRIVSRRLTWSPPEKGLDRGSMFNFCIHGKPDGLNKNNSAVRWYVYGDKYDADEWHVFSTEKRARTFVKRLHARDSNIDRIKAAIKVFSENGFHHGEYYSPCSVSMKCRHCVDAAIDILGLTAPN